VCLRFLTLLFGLLGSGLALAPGGAAAQASPPYVLRADWFVPDVATVLARDNGSLARVGLDATYTVTTGSVPQMHGLSDGSYDLAYTSFDNVLAWSGREGAEIVGVAQTDGGVVLPLYVRPEVASWDDLRGKKLAVDAVDTAYALVLRRLLLAHDLDLDRGDYELVAVGGGQQRLDSMVRGETSAAIMNAPANIAAAAAGMVLFADHREVVPDYPGTVIAVNRAWAEAHRDELVAFLRAWVAAGRATDADRDAASQVLVRAVKAPPDQVAGLLPIDWQDGVLNRPGLQSVIDLRTRFGFALLMGTDLSSYVDTSFYQAAVGATSTGK